tara:strand:- start:67 stop:591 length:525 start_codon:yes stop_codon:yes gene_type:complete
MALVGTNNIIQTKVLQVTNMVTTNPGTSFQEVSDAFRLTITPKFSNSMILLEYMVPLNQSTTSANNIFGFQGYRISGGSGGAGAITSRGPSSGSRKRTAGGMMRAQNGYDQNDHNLESWTAFDYPNTTSAVTYGLQVFQESSDSGTIYIAHSGHVSASWAMSSRVIITASEIEQ